MAEQVSKYDIEYSSTAPLRDENQEERSYASSSSLSFVSPHTPPSMNQRHGSVPSLVSFATSSSPSYHSEGCEEEGSLRSSDARCFPPSHFHKIGLNTELYVEGRSDCDQMSSGLIGSSTLMFGHNDSCFPGGVITTARALQTVMDWQSDDSCFLNPENLDPWELDYGKDHVHLTSAFDQLEYQPQYERWVVNQQQVPLRYDGERSNTVPSDGSGVEDFHNNSGVSPTQLMMDPQPKSETTLDDPVNSSDKHNIYTEMQRGSLKIAVSEINYPKKRASATSGVRKNRPKAKHAHDSRPKICLDDTVEPRYCDQCSSHFKRPEHLERHHDSKHSTLPKKHRCALAELGGRGTCTVNNSTAERVGDDECDSDASVQKKHKAAGVGGRKKKKPGMSRTDNFGAHYLLHVQPASTSRRARNKRVNHEFLFYCCALHHREHAVKFIGKVLSEVERHNNRFASRERKIRAGEALTSVERKVSGPWCYAEPNDKYQTRHPLYPSFLERKKRGLALYPPQICRSSGGSQIGVSSDEATDKAAAEFWQSFPTLEDLGFNSSPSSPFEVDSSEAEPAE